jgi:hypothetical protein
MAKDQHSEVKLQPLDMDALFCRCQLTGGRKLKRHNGYGFAVPYWRRNFARHAFRKRSAYRDLHYINILCGLKSTLVHTAVQNTYTCPFRLPIGVSLGLQTCVAWADPLMNILSVDHRSFCSQQVVFWVPCAVWAFAGVPFLYSLCSAFVKLRWFVNHQINFVLVVFFINLSFWLY